MHITLPNGDRLVPDRELAEKLGLVSRTLSNWDREGLPFAMIGGLKYRPERECLEWVQTIKIRRRNPRRTAKSAAA
jgi:hypothetical protein